MDITHFFDACDIWPDTNGDGYPDDLGLTIAVDSGVTDSAMWAGILNLTARLAFETTAFNLPIVCTRGRKRFKISLVVMSPGSYPPGFKQNSIESHVWQPEPAVAYLVGDSAQEMGRILNRMAYGEPKAGHSGCHFSAFPVDLLNLAGENGIYGKAPQHPRSRILRAGILLETPIISHKLGQSLAEMTAMMSLGATEITLPIADCEKTLNHEILFVIREGSQSPDYVTLISTKDGDPQEIHIQGDIRTLPNALKKWIAWALVDGGPGSKDIDRFREQVAAVQRIVSRNIFTKRNNRAGMIGNLPQTILKNVPQPFQPPYEFSIPPVQPGADGKIEDHTAWSGEIDVILDLALRIPGGIGKIHGLILLSKPEEKRKYIKNTLEEIFGSRGYDPELIVLNAYKPGLNWLMEIILPKLKCCPDIASLDIYYKPFIGMDGALELRSRWLQELFPAAELLAGQLGLETDRVCFIETQDQPDIYRIQALSSLKEIRIDQGFSPRWSRMIYLEGCPDRGHVHPTTSGIRLWQTDKLILDQSIPTDREMFWQVFQKNWLPALMASMRNRNICHPGEHASAFWENIRLSVWIEETDEILGIGEERICPMEALHEDIYFVLLAAFADFSQTCSLPDFLQLGRIMPKTYSCLRGKKPSARLVAQPMAWEAGVGGEADAGCFETWIKGPLRLFWQAAASACPFPSSGC